MTRLSEFSVIFDEDVLAWIPERQKKAYPNETGMFLFGNYWESKFNIPFITLASEPAGIESDKNTWDFTHEEVVRQIRLAAAQGHILLGWSHSHPAKTPYSDLNVQSLTDAKTQIYYRLTVSLIVSIWENNGSLDWYPTCWKEGFSAPLDIWIKLNNGELISLNRWYFNKHKRRPWIFNLDKSIK